MSNFVSFLFLIKDKCKKGRGTDKNLDGTESARQVTVGNLAEQVADRV